jgi:hypothetical protein
LWLRLVSLAMSSPSDVSIVFPLLFAVAFPSLHILVTGLADELL